MKNYSELTEVEKKKWGYPEITPDIENPAKQFISFCEKHCVEWMVTEQIVCSPTYFVGGTLDSLAVVDGILSLVDLKTSSSMRESYLLQTAGYCLCLKEMGVPVDQRIILRLPKVKDDKFEAILADTPLEVDTKAFLAQREAYGWKNFIECKHCDEVKEKGYTKKVLKLKKI